MDDPFRPVPTADRYTTAHGARHRRTRAAARSFAAACALACAAAAPARAHESPAEAPEFFASDCITVVDPSAQDSVEIAYAVAFDDTLLMEGDIPVEDAKTHQFFAYRGMLFPQGFGQELFAFDADMPDPVALPLWITVDDVKRAAQANMTASGTTFAESDVPENAVLEHHTQLEGRWLRITEDDARLPITIAQAQRGVRWQLAGVSAGLYTVAGYIWSPPYNGWAVRPGLMKVVADGVDPPAAVVETVHEILFAYEGRRVRACVDAPEGSTLRASFRVVERPEIDWLPWIDSRPVESDSLELCFRNPRPELTGSVRLRLQVTTADGETTTVYPPDTITVLQGNGECAPSDTICCEPAPDPPADPCASGAVAGCDAGPAGVAGDAGQEPIDPPEPPSSGAGEGGCTAAPLAAKPSPGHALGPLALWLFAWRARRRSATRAAGVPERRPLA